MIAYLILGLMLFFSLVLAARWFAVAPARQVALAIKVAALVIVAVAVVLLAVSGRLGWILLALPALLPWLMRARTIADMLKTARGPSGGQRSAVETRSLSMELDHDTGEMDGDILDGPFEGRRLSDLDRVLLIDFFRWCAANDPDAARLLEAYLDRTIGAEWREETGHGGEAGEGASESATGMTRDEALSVLGLEPGASADDVREAYRRLMRHAHPDRGGSPYLAAKINAAKDVLLAED